MVRQRPFCKTSCHCLHRLAECESPWLSHLSNVSCACCSNAGSDRTRRTASSCNAKLCRSCTSWRASCARTRTCTTGLAWRERAAAVPAGEGCRASPASRSEEHTSELQSQSNLVCRLLLEKKKNKRNITNNTSTTPRHCR